MTPDQLAIVGAVLIAAVAVVGGFSWLFREIDARHVCPTCRQPHEDDQ